MYSSSRVLGAVYPPMTLREAQLYMRVCAPCVHPVGVHAGLLFAHLYSTNASVFSVRRSVVLSTLRRSAS